MIEDGQVEISLSERAMPVVEQWACTKLKIEQLNKADLRNESAAKQIYELWGIKNELEDMILEIFRPKIIKFIEL